MDIVKDLNLGLRFLLELLALAALGFWGWRIADGPAARALFAVAFPLAAAVVWGAFVAPQASFAAPEGVKLLLQVAIFGLAAFGLARTGHPGMAAGLGTAVLANAVLMLVWHQ